MGIARRTHAHAATLCVADPEIQHFLPAVRKNLDPKSRGGLQSLLLKSPTFPLPPDRAIGEDVLQKKVLQRRVEHSCGFILWQCWRARRLRTAMKDICTEARAEGVHHDGELDTLKSPLIY